MSDTTEREWRFYLDDMIAFAGKVIAYTDNVKLSRPMERSGSGSA